VILGDIPVVVFPSHTEFHYHAAMPNTESAKKRMRQNEVRRLRNRAVKSALKTQIRKVRESAGQTDAQAAETEFRRATKKLDQAAAHGVIHDNTASRLKSRLSALLKRSKQKE